MDVIDIRCENLRGYIADNKYKTQKEFAEKVGKSISQVNAWFSTSKGKKNIGEKLARELEKTLELPSGWLDKKHNPHEHEFVDALTELGYDVFSNEEAFDYNDLAYAPQYRVQNGMDSFLLTTISDPFLNKTLMKIVNGINLFHSHDVPKNAILLLCEDDLAFAKHGGLQNVIDERLGNARFGSPYIEEDFLISADSTKIEEKSANFGEVFKQFWSKFSNEDQHNDAVFIAKQLLEKKGYHVFEAPISDSSRLMVLNKSLWSMPGLIVYLPEKCKSFFIDIYPEKRLSIIPVLPDNKFSEILFVKQTEVINIPHLVQEHINKWFS